MCYRDLEEFQSAMLRAKKGVFITLTVSDVIYDMT